MTECTLLSGRFSFHRRRLWALTILAVLGGCGQAESPSEPEASGGAAAASAAQSGVSRDTAARDTVPDSEHWSCPSESGQAPSGSLKAERIPETRPDREEEGLYEGPVWIDGALYFSDFTFAEGFPSRVQRLNDDGDLETVIENSGSNGLAVDAEGQLMAATHDAKAISRYDLDTGEREIVWRAYEDNPFNSPNDLTVTREGVLFFTDPDFQRSAAPGGQPETRVYRVDEDGIQVIEEDMENPNGVSLSPDEETLYVAGGGEEGVLRAYRLGESGDVLQTRDLASVSVPDGMAIDCLGNIYVTEHRRQQVRVFSPEGEELAQIAVDANVTNAAFGGPDRQTLYLTGAGTLWQIQLDVAGYPY